LFRIDHFDSRSTVSRLRVTTEVDGGGGGGGGDGAAVQKKISDIKRTELDKVKAEKKRREDLKKQKEENRKKATIVQKVRPSRSEPQKSTSVDG